MDRKNYKKRVKVIVLGNAEAGKSTLIKTIIPESINIEHKGRTIALDFGVIEEKGIRFHIFGTPGQKRFETMRNIVTTGAELFIYVLDPLIGISDYDTEIISLLKKEGLKGFFFINIKDEDEKILDIEELVSFLQPNNYQFLTGSARDLKIKEKILKELINLLGA